jgi:hypothetical protein
MGQLAEVLEKIDEFNMKDPKIEEFLGKTMSSELVYSVRVTNWVKQLIGQPTEELLIASRGVHIGRWEVPRENYPAGLQGYYQWKTFLHQYHAKKVAGIMESCGYSTEAIKIVSDIITRKKLKENPATQALEDAVSLVFLEIQLIPLMSKASEEKVINAIVKTWAKMSSAGQAKALSLNLPPEAMAVIKKALK